MPQRTLTDARTVPCWTTFVGALAGALAIGGDGWSLAEIAGRTGFAFRMNVGRDVNASGPSTYPNAETLRRAFDQAGRDFDHFTAAPADNIFARRQSRAIAGIEQAIERGMPAVAWGLLLTEYGLITGYDSDERLFSVSTVLGEQADAAGVRYGDLGMSGGAFLDVAVPLERVDAPEERVAASALKLAVGHALGAEPHYAGYANGLAGYGMWIDALREGRAELFGMAYNVQVYGEARRFAREFLAAPRAFPATVSCDAIAEAAEDYRRVADNFASLAEIFQFSADLPREERVSGQAAQDAVELLERALFWERQGVEKLEKALSGRRGGGGR